MTEPEADRPAGERSGGPSSFLAELKEFLETEVDSEKIDRDRKIPDHVLERLREMRAFGLKIPEEYGGHGFGQVEYNQVMALLGSVDGSLVALLSAHQSIGVPQPLKLFGTEEQKKRFLPRLAAGAVSAFALTEDDVGSDPARLSTTYRESEDGDSIRRRRACDSCGERFTTRERSESARIQVLKRDGSRQEFDRRKLASAIGKAASGAIILGNSSGATGTLEYTGSGHTR